MSTGPPQHPPDRPAKDKNKLTAEPTWRRTKMAGASSPPKVSTPPSRTEQKLPGVRLLTPSPSEALKAVNALSHRSANWNSTAEYVAAHMQEQLLDMIGLRYALCFVPLTHIDGKLYPLCPVCFLQRRGQQIVEPYGAPGENGHEHYRCRCCAEIFDITPAASLTAPEPSDTRGHHAS